MHKVSVNNFLNIRGKIMSIDEYFPGSACRLWILVDKAGTDKTKRRSAVPIHCFNKEVFKSLKQLEHVCILAHLEAMKQSFGNIAIADQIVPLDD